MVHTVFDSITKLQCLYISYRSHPCRISGVEPTILAKVASMGLPSSDVGIGKWYHLSLPRVQAGKSISRQNRSWLAN
eukprot:COSAG02_NODE_50098_length_322_cov_1.448430_1_plen_76_part_10